ncbi:hypothetical protein AB0O14_10025 [Microbacterium foliorum]
MRVFLWICSVAAVLGGAAIVLTSLPDAPWGRLDPSPLAGGVALGAVGITSGIALVTSASFTSQRKLATEALLRDQRAAAYRDILAGMIRAFTKDGLPDIPNERATVAMWASPASIVAFEKWFTYSWDNRGPTNIAQKPYMYALFGECIENMRLDLGIDSKKAPVNQHALMQMIFVSYEKDLYLAQKLLTKPDSLDERPRTLRRSNVVWGGLLALLAVLSVGAWVQVAVKGGSEWYLWLTAIAFTVATASGIFMVPFTRNAIRRLVRRHGQTFNRSSR